MEVCGGQTHTLVRYGLDEMLQGAVETIHGPGCPVCVTPASKIDLAVSLAETPGVVLTTFGDMMRVPGSKGDLLEAKARGAQVRMVYSPLDALNIARQEPDSEIVFFAVGFETTAPANAMAAWVAKQGGVRNFSLLCSHVRVPPAIRLIMGHPETAVQGFLAPGHVCAVMGFKQYESLSAEFRVPFVVTGFEVVDLLQGIAQLVEMLETGRTGVENEYARAVRRDGNQAAMDKMREVLRVVDAEWRGLGFITDGGLSLRPEYQDFDAEVKFSLKRFVEKEEGQCIAGAILQGIKKPTQCPVFGHECTPEHPLGAPMVSTEGACAAYFHYRRIERPTSEGGTGAD